MSLPLSAAVPFGGDDNPRQETEPLSALAILRLPAYRVVVLEGDR
ncbi:MULTISPECIES: hypothetical protein [Micromonospora]|nr:hypothetical protein [Micromonospora sp. NBRC 107095]GLZ61458.1 hypothetical protein Misp05_50340 [Micromonospora sp. NBRC 107095]